jgi:hypothetical protein
VAIGDLAALADDVGMGLEQAEQLLGRRTGAPATTRRSVWAMICSIKGR